MYMGYMEYRMWIIIIHLQTNLNGMSCYRKLPKKSYIRHTCDWRIDAAGRRFLKFVDE